MSRRTTRTFSMSSQPFSLSHGVTLLVPSDSMCLLPSGRQAGEGKQSGRRNFNVHLISDSSRPPLLAIVRGGGSENKG